MDLRLIRGPPLGVLRSGAYGVSCRARGLERLVRVHMPLRLQAGVAPVSRFAPARWSNEIWQWVPRSPPHRAEATRQIESTARLAGPAPALCESRHILQQSRYGQGHAFDRPG